jgi:Ner family transcriptional regulator
VKKGKKGWHPQDIVAAVKKSGSSLQALGRANGFSRTTFNKATSIRFPRAHQVIAEFLGVPRQIIWPQFYHEDGSPKEFRQVRSESAKDEATTRTSEARAA